MKVTLDQLIDGQNALIEFGSEKNFPIKVSYKAGKIIKKVKKELTDFFEARTAILNELGTLPNGAMQYLFETPEKQKEAEEKIKELSSIEVEIAGEPISLEAFSNKVSVSPNVLAALDWMITDE